MADAPFHCPPELVVDLPFPPSVNKIWRHSAAISSKSVVLAPSYLRWKSAADALLMATKDWRKAKITDRFTAVIIICAPTQGHQRGDLDNRVKAIFDFLQRVEIIRNDKDCQKFSIEWGTPISAPTGCRVFLSPCLTMADVRDRTEKRLEATS